MKTLLALILSWLMPAQGKRRATPPADGRTNRETVARTADEPTQRLIISRAASPTALLGVGLPNPPEHLREEDVPPIRPYLIAWERTHGIHYSQEAAV